MNKDIIRDLKRFESIKNDNGKHFQIMLKYFVFSSSFRSIYFYRLLSHSFFKKNEKVSKIFSTIFGFFTEVELPLTSKIGYGFLMPHPKCIIIHSRCEIGNNVTISQGVTIGGNIWKEKNGRTSPIIGDNVLLGAGAKVLGPVTVGKNCIIGANAVVITDIPENSVAVGVPAKSIKNVNKSFFELSKEHK